MDGLADPPHGVGDELEAPSRVEPVYGRHQTEIAGADKLHERHPTVAVVLGDGDDEQEIGLGELLASPLIASRDAL